MSKAALLVGNNAEDNDQAIAAAKPENPETKPPETEKATATQRQTIKGGATTGAEREDGMIELRSGRNAIVSGNVTSGKIF